MVDAYIVPLAGIYLGFWALVRSWGLAVRLIRGGF